MTFQTINQGYNTVFKPHKLSLGLVIPIETYPNSSVPRMEGQVELILLAEKLGFKAIWLRDIPFNVPSFGDAGQMFDPFTYLGFLAAKTSTIALATGSIILPLRHPAHVAKSAASIDVLSNGRLILGIASGDRPQEYPALNIQFEERGARFRESFEYISEVWKENAEFQNILGSPYGGMDMLPKPLNGKVPMLITGASQQSPAWLSSHGDGWITYPRNPDLQRRLIDGWREGAKVAGAPYKPVSQSLYLDLVEDSDASAQMIHLGFKSGTNHLRDHFKALESAGVNHVALNLRLNQANIKETLERLAKEVLPEFS